MVERRFIFTVFLFQSEVNLSSLSLKRAGVVKYPFEHLSHNRKIAIAKKLCIIEIMAKRSGNTTTVLTTSDPIALESILAQVDNSANLNNLAEVLR
jgi:hypothetical protein